MVQGLGKDLHVAIEAGKHRFASGIPVADGGQDEAPSPHVLLEAALSACTILTLELYAKRKAWTLGTISCEVTITSESAGETKMSRVVSFSEKVDEEMRARLETIANKCPVHRILSGKVEIQTTVRG